MGEVAGKAVLLAISVPSFFTRLIVSCAVSILFKLCLPGQTLAVSIATLNHSVDGGLIAAYTFSSPYFLFILPMYSGSME